MLDVDGVVEIARGFAVDGDDRKMAEIFASLRVGFGYGLRERFGFVSDFGRKDMRQVMLADDDLNIYAEITGATENFDDAPGGRCAAARKLQDFDVDDGAVEFSDVGNAALMFWSCAIRRSGGRQAEFLRELRSQLVAGKNFDGVLHTGVVGQDVVAALAEAEEADDTGMGAVENANNAAFGALRAGACAGAKDFGEDVVAVHGVLDGVAGDKDVTGVLWGGDIGDDEAVAVMVEDEAAGEFVAAGGGLGLGCTGGALPALRGCRTGIAFPF
jgi:hypothetical protein